VPGRHTSPPEGVADTDAVISREHALEELGLEPGATAAEVEAAYSARTRQNGGLNGSEKLSRGREVLRGSEDS
jgi:hypothetical protein